jgi:hypothetical protein
LGGGFTTSKQGAVANVQIQYDGGKKARQKACFSPVKDEKFSYTLRQATDYNKGANDKIKKSDLILFSS